MISNVPRYQQSDLDLVRCRHGNYDSVKRNRSVDTVLGDSGRRYGRGVSLEDKCHRNSDLDLVGTLPKRKQDARNSGRSLQSNSSSSQPCIANATTNDKDDNLLMKMVHKPDCELFKHRQQLAGKCVDLKLSKLMSGGEPQDQGYASERSPEDEHPPSLPGQPFPSVTPGKRLCNYYNIVSLGFFSDIRATFLNSLPPLFCSRTLVPPSGKGSDGLCQVFTTKE